MRVGGLEWIIINSVSPITLAVPDIVIVTELTAQTDGTWKLQMPSFLFHWYLRTKINLHSHVKASNIGMQYSSRRT